MKVEMIIEYVTDGVDYQYNDNHGELIRCKDCAYYRYPEWKKEGRKYCFAHGRMSKEDWFCADGERRGD